MLYDPAAASTSGSTSNYRNPEFIAVIFAGEGSDQWQSGEDEATEATNGSTQPKALQQVDGKPRIDGVLKWIEEADVSDVVILAPEWQHSGISSYLRSRKSAAKDTITGEAPATPLSQLKIDLEILNEDLASENENLRIWAEKKNPYKSADMIVLPSDFLNNFGNKFMNAPPSLTTLLDKHRLDENLVTTAVCEKKPITSKKQKEVELPPLLIAYDAKSSTLLDIRELEEFDETVSIRNTLIEKFPVLSLSTVLQLSHVYVCSRHILPILSLFPELKRFDDQIIPWLCKAQWQKNLLTRNRDGKALESLEHSQANALARSSTRSPSARTQNSKSKVACIITRQS